jgi:hypothetical protein
MINAKGVELLSSEIRRKEDRLFIVMGVGN